MEYQLRIHRKKGTQYPTKHSSSWFERRHLSKSSDLLFPPPASTEMIIERIMVRFKTSLHIPPTGIETNGTDFQNQVLFSSSRTRWPPLHWWRRSDVHLWFVRQNYTQPLRLVDNVGSTSWLQSVFIKGSWESYESRHSTVKLCVSSSLMVIWPSRTQDRHEETRNRFPINPPFRWPQSKQVIGIISMAGIFGKKTGPVAMIRPAKRSLTRVRWSWLTSYKIKSN